MAAFSKYDLKKAFSYYKKACDLGNERACVNILRSNRKLTEEEYYDAIGSSSDYSNKLRIQALTHLIDLYTNTSSSKLQEAYKKRMNFYYFEDKKYKLAITDANKALSLNPKDEEALLRKVWSYFKLNKHEEVSKEIDEYITANPGHAFAYEARAMLNIKRKQFEKAMVDVEKVISLTPFSPHDGATLKAAVYFSKNDETGLKSYMSSAINSCNQAKLKDSTFGCIALTPTRTDPFLFIKTDPLYARSMGRDFNREWLNDVDCL